MADLCARCARPAREVCWWCPAGLCGPCWEESGHCGHPEAEWVNLVGMAVPQPPGHPDHVPDEHRMAVRVLVWLLLWVREDTGRASVPATVEVDP